MKFKSGYVAIVGRANVGKSTILNTILNNKVSIVTDKSQTTRNKIKGVYTDELKQIIFVDTPGMHKPKNALDEKMKSLILSTVNDVDLILFVIDGSTGFGTGDEYMYNIVKDKKTIFLINKIDLASQDEINELYLRFKDEFLEVIPISAINRETVIGLLDKIGSYLKEGPMYYPKDYLTDKDFKFSVSEIIREKALLYLEQEVPHSLAVEVESFKNEEKLLTINIVIYVERDSQKGIVIGKRGRKLKGILKSSRLEIEDLYSKKVMLEAWVKVDKNWRSSNYKLNQLGYLDE